MDMPTLKGILSKGVYTMNIVGAFGKPKTVTLTAPPGTNLTFTTLGTGSMKRVVKVDNENWVLALSGDSDAAKTDMDGEVSTLLGLALHRIRVPQPFRTTITKDEILFEMTVYNEDIGDEKVYPAFIQQYLPYVEMDKIARKEDFAKNSILQGNVVPATIQTTVDDLTTILTRLKQREWGDFQVMYDRQTGYVYVFDPLPDNNSGTSFVPLVKRWLDDIEIARELQRRRRQQPGRPRRQSF